MKQNIRRTLSLLLCLVLMFQLAEPTLAVWQEDAPTAAQAEAGRRYIHTARSDLT